MKTSEFIGDVKHIPTDAIKPSARNPRGTAEEDDSFERLVASIERVGILVPIVVAALPKAEGGIKYELVDGERRFRAAKKLGKERVPAHVLHSGIVPSELRTLMFHLHMTREQWGAMAQCRSLVDAYPDLRAGLTFEQKSSWVRKLSDEAGMPIVTARDRVHVLSWPEPLKDRFFRFDEEQPKRNIYSYVLALEASIVEPSRLSFPEFYNGDRSADATANEVRHALLGKTIDGIETGSLTSREQIRNVSPLFSKTLIPKQKRAAVGIFRDFIKGKDTQFDDVRAEITTRLPELLEEKPPKPTRVIAAIAGLTRTLQRYEIAYIDVSTKSEAKRRRLRSEFAAALRELVKSAKRLEERL